MANVLFRRGTQEYINNNVPISDGQVVFNETDQAIYVDTPVNNVITRLRYGGGNLSRSDIDSALSDTSENPVQNKVITESVLQKTDVVNDYNTAVAVTATDIPVGCGVIKTANTKIGDLQSALNTTNGTVAQHTTDIQALNTGLANIKVAISGHKGSGISISKNLNLPNATDLGSVYSRKGNIVTFRVAIKIPSTISSNWYSIFTNLPISTDNQCSLQAFVINDSNDMYAITNLGLRDSAFAGDKINTYIFDVDAGKILWVRGTINL